MKPNKKHSDPEWIHLLKMGDEQTLQDLWELLTRYGIAIARQNGQDDSIGEDAAQEAFIGIVYEGGIQRYALRSSFEGYCKRAVVNKYLNLVTGRRAAIEDIEDHLEIAAIISPDETAKEWIEILSPCWDALPTVFQKVLEMFFFQEYPPPEIALLLNISRSNVNVINHRARKALLDCLQHRGYLSLDQIIGQSL